MNKIYVIVGPTGVGKTKLSIMLAKKINAEIISCDAMQVYQELNIGVAKITMHDQENIPHHLLNIKSINDEYNVFDYQKDGRIVLDKLLKENKNIIIVGGTGLYLKALLYDYTFDHIGNKNKKLYDFRIIGLTADRQNLYDIINKRVDNMIENGLIEEVKDLYDQKIRSRVVMKTAIGYKELYEYFDKKITLEEAILQIKLKSRRYAKRQYTFFKNQFKDIIWYNVDEISLIDIVKEIT